MAGSRAAAFLLLVTLLALLDGVVGQFENNATTGEAEFLSLAEAQQAHNEGFELRLGIPINKLSGVLWVDALKVESADVRTGAFEVSAGGGVSFKLAVDIQAHVAWSFSNGEVGTPPASLDKFVEQFGDLAATNDGALPECEDDEECVIAQKANAPKARLNTQIVPRTTATLELSIESEFLLKYSADDRDSGDTPVKPDENVKAREAQKLKDKKSKQGRHWTMSARELLEDDSLPEHAAFFLLGGENMITIPKAMLSLNGDTTKVALSQLTGGWSALGTGLGWILGGNQVLKVERDVSSGVCSTPKKPFPRSDRVGLLISFLKQSFKIFTLPFKGISAIPSATSAVIGRGAQHLKGEQTKGAIAHAVGSCIVTNKVGKLVNSYEQTFSETLKSTLLATSGKPLATLALLGSKLPESGKIKADISLHAGNGIVTDTNNLEPVFDFARTTVQELMGQSGGSNHDWGSRDPDLRRDSARYAQDFEADFLESGITDSNGAQEDISNGISVTRVLGSVKDYLELSDPHPDLSYWQYTKAMLWDQGGLKSTFCSLFPSCRGKFVLNMDKVKFSKLKLAKVTGMPEHSRGVNVKVNTPAMRKQDKVGVQVDIGIEFSLEDFDIGISIDDDDDPSSPDCMKSSRTGMQKCYPILVVKAKAPLIKARVGFTAMMGPGEGEKLQWTLNDPAIDGKFSLELGEMHPFPFLDGGLIDDAMAVATWTANTRAGKAATASFFNNIVHPLVMYALKSEPPNQFDLNGEESGNAEGAAFSTEPHAEQGDHAARPGRQGSVQEQPSTWKITNAVAAVYSWLKARMMAVSARLQKFLLAAGRKVKNGALAAGRKVKNGALAAGRKVKDGANKLGLVAKEKLGDALQSDSLTVTTNEDGDTSMAGTFNSDVSTHPLIAVLKNGFDRPDSDDAEFGLFLDMDVSVGVDSQRSDWFAAWKSVLQPMLNPKAQPNPLEDSFKSLAATSFTTIGQMLIPKDGQSDRLVTVAAAADNIWKNMEKHAWSTKLTNAIIMPMHDNHRGQTCFEAVLQVESQQSFSRPKEFSNKGALKACVVTTTDSKFRDGIHVKYSRSGACTNYFCTTVPVRQPIVDLKLSIGKGQAQQLMCEGYVPINKLVPFVSTKAQELLGGGDLPGTKLGGDLISYLNLNAMNKEASAWKIWKSQKGRDTDTHNLEDTWATFIWAKRATTVNEMVSPITDVFARKMKQEDVDTPCPPGYSVVQQKGTRTEGYDYVDANDVGLHDSLPVVTLKDVNTVKIHLKARPACQAALGAANADGGAPPINCITIKFKSATSHAQELAKNREYTVIWDDTMELTQKEALIKGAKEGVTSRWFGGRADFVVSEVSKSTGKNEHGSGQSFGMVTIKHKTGKSGGQEFRFRNFDPNLQDRSFGSHTNRGQEQDGHSPQAEKVYLCVSKQANMPPLLDLETFPGTAEGKALVENAKYPKNSLHPISESFAHEVVKFSLDASEKVQHERVKGQEDADLQAGVEFKKSAIGLVATYQKGDRLNRWLTNPDERAKMLNLEKDASQVGTAKAAKAPQIVLNDEVELHGSKDVKAEETEYPREYLTTDKFETVEAAEAGCPSGRHLCTLAEVAQARHAWTKEIAISDFVGKKEKIMQAFMPFAAPGIAQKRKGAPVSSWGFIKTESFRVFLPESYDTKPKIHVAGMFQESCTPVLLQRRAAEWKHSPGDLTCSETRLTQTENNGAVFSAWIPKEGSYPAFCCTDFPKNDREDMKAMSFAFLRAMKTTTTSNPTFKVEVSRCQAGYFQINNDQVLAPLSSGSTHAFHHFHSAEDYCLENNMQVCTVDQLSARFEQFGVKLPTSASGKGCNWGWASTGPATQDEAEDETEECKPSQDLLEAANVEPAHGGIRQAVKQVVTVASRKAKAGLDAVAHKVKETVRGRDYLEGQKFCQLKSETLPKLAALCKNGCDSKRAGTHIDPLNRMAHKCESHIRTREAPKAEHMLDQDQGWPVYCCAVDGPKAVDIGLARYQAACEKCEKARPRKKCCGGRV